MKIESKAINAGIGYTIGNISLKGISFLSIPIFTRVLTTSDYGMFNTYSAIESILFIIIGLCLHVSVKNAKFDFSEKEYNKYISSIILLSLFSCLSFTVIINILFDLFASFVDNSRLILNILIWHSYGTALLTFYNQKIALDYEYKKFLKISFFNAFLNIGLSLILMFTLMKSNRFIARVLGAATPMIIIGFYVFIKFTKTEFPKINKEYWKYSLKISLPLIPHGISQVILAQLDRIMIQSMTSPAMAGLYSFSYNIGMILQTLISSADTVWTTWFYEKMNKRRYEEIEEIAVNYVWLFSTITELLLLASPEIIMILGPKEYWVAKYSALPIIISIYFSFLYTLPANVEYYYKKTKYIALGTVGAAIINIILNLIFIRLYGYIAAAYTTLVSYMVYFIFHYLISRKICIEKIFNLKKIIINIICIFLIYLFSIIFIEKLFIRLLLGITLIVFSMIYIYEKKLIEKVVKRKKEC